MSCSGIGESGRAQAQVIGYDWWPCSRHSYRHYSMMGYGWGWGWWPWNIVCQRDSPSLSVRPSGRAFSPVTRRGDVRGS